MSRYLWICINAVGYCESFLRQKNNTKRCKGTKETNECPTLIYEYVYTNKMVNVRRNCRPQSCSNSTETENEASNYSWEQLSSVNVDFTKCSRYAELANHRKSNQKPGIS